MNVRFARHVSGWGVCAALAAGLLVCAAGTAQGFQFSSQDGEWKGSFDTTITFGAMWRLQDQDPALVGITNGGTSRSVNEDDGNLNYDRGDLVSALVKGTHEFDLTYRNYGVFLRGYYFYDYAAAQKREELGPRAEERLVLFGEFLDAYARATFDFGGRSLNLRAGRQVVNWGESTFIPNGINVINPVDVSRLRSPGAELREALLPTPLVWASQGITGTTTVEAVVLTSHDKVRIDPRGAFFSTNDYVSDDGEKVYIGFGRRNDQHDPPGTFGVHLDASAWAPRSPDRDAKESGQYGFSLRQLAPGLNNTEFGFYYLTYHSRTPIISGVRGGVTAVTPVPGCSVFDIPTLFATNNFPLACTVAGGRAGTYFVEYPEDIDLYGLSFNTPGPAGIALQGEISYRPQQPLQLAAPELLLAAMGLPNNITGVTTTPPATYGTEVSGYREVKMYQAQMTGTKLFGPTLGADQFTLVAEAGYTYLDLPSGLLFNGPGVHLPAPGSANAASGSFQQEGYATKSSWGYRAVARMDFENALAGATLSPRIGFSHDVRGVSPTFNRGAMAVTAGLGYNLRQVWQADIAYTSYFGGRTYAGTDPGAVPLGQSADYASSANPLKDRDFLSVSVSYAF